MNIHVCKALGYFTNQPVNPVQFGTVSLGHQQASSPSSLHGHKQANMKLLKQTSVD